MTVKTLYSSTTKVLSYRFSQDTDTSLAHFNARPHRYHNTKASAKFQPVIAVLVVSALRRGGTRRQMIVFHIPSPPPPVFPRHLACTNWCMFDMPFCRSQCRHYLGTTACSPSSNLSWLTVRHQKYAPCTGNNCRMVGECVHPFRKVIVLLAQQGPGYNCALFLLSST